MVKIDDFDLDEDVFGVLTPRPAKLSSSSLKKWPGCDER
jgi:hypothetical protein